MSEYQFTQDWFHWAPEVWEQLVPLLPERNKEGRSFMEIGSFEGRSTVWIIENMMQDGDEIYCVDTWEGGEEHSAEDMVAVEKRFSHNIGVAVDKFPDKVVIWQKGTSTRKLAEIIQYEGEGGFDFIYIDGSHTAPDVLTDACMAWPLLKQGGVMVFDDYLWSLNPRDILHRPKIAIDAFVNIFAEEVEVVHVGYQFIVRKK
jgi:predicted O-methyltransferase YrrM